MSILMQHRGFGLLASVWCLTRALARERAAAVMVETAMTFPALLLFVFGIVESGHLLWTQTVLHLAVQDAARCASVNSTLCPDSTSVQNYAAARSWGMTIPPSTFTLTLPSSTHACGYEVVARYAFTPIVSYIPISMTLTAKTCFPQWS
jgi:Flp pilus assembly protein TadG